MNDGVHGGSHLLANRTRREIDACEHCQGFKAPECIFGRIGMQGRKAPIVSGVHGLQNVEGLPPAAFPNDNSIGSHSKGMSHEISNSHGTSPLQIGRACLEPNDVIASQSKFGAVLYGHHPFLRGNRTRKNVEKRGFARPRSAGNHNVAPVPGQLLEQQKLLG
jgi:hypothetical protein